MKNLALTITITIMFMASCVYASPTKKSRNQYNIEKMSKELALSTEQASKIRELRKRNEADRKLNLRNVDEAQESFLSITGNAKATRAEIMQAYNTLQIAKSTHNRTGFEEVLAIRELLNETQRLKFHDIVTKDLKK